MEAHEHWLRGRIIRGFLDATRNGNRGSGDPLFAQDITIVFPPARSWNEIEELCRICGTAYFFQEARILKALGERVFALTPLATRRFCHLSQPRRPPSLGAQLQKARLKAPGRIFSL